jgi:hypothetical protein
MVGRYETQCHAARDPSLLKGCKGLKLLYQRELRASRCPRVRGRDWIAQAGNGVSPDSMALGSVVVPGLLNISFDPLSLPELALVIH